MLPRLHSLGQLNKWDMKKKFHWGHGIAVFYTVFVLVLIRVLFASFNGNTNLVDDEYYQRDLAYQSQYDKTVNTLSSDKVDLKLNEQSNQLVLNFKDASKVKGNLHLYRPSDKSKDVIIELDRSNNEFSTADLAKGKWIAKLDVVLDGKGYYQEKVLFL